MNTELFIAQRIIKGKRTKKNISSPIIKIAIAGIALGMTVMILSLAITRGFKKELSDKVVGFSSHIQILNYDSNQSLETIPISKEQPFIDEIKNLEEVKFIQIFATKPGIIKTNDEIQGVAFKGVDNDYNWDFISQHMVEGTSLVLNDSVKSNGILISQKLASMLKLKLGEKAIAYFVDNPPRIRKFTVEGIYNTSLEEYDKNNVFIDIRHIQKLNNWDTLQVTGFEIALNNFEEIEPISQKIERIVGYGFDEKGNMLKVQTIIDKESFLFAWTELFDVNVWVILTLMICVAGVNMISGLLILILERTQMIGVLKALGTSNWSIRKVFLYNGAYLIGIGMLIGNIIGLVLCLIQWRFGIIKLDPASYYVDIVPILLRADDILLLNAGTLLVTTAMLILPSIIVTKIQPSKAIQFN